MLKTRPGRWKIGALILALTQTTTFSMGVQAAGKAPANQAKIDKAPSATGSAAVSATASAAPKSGDDAFGSLTPNAKPGDKAVLDHVHLLNSNTTLASRADMTSLHNYLVTTIQAITNYFNKSKRGKPIGLSVQCNMAPGSVVFYELQVRPVERQDAKMGVELTDMLEKLKAPAVTGPVGVQILMRVFYPRPEVTALVKKGLTLQKSGKTQDAIAAYSQALALDAENIEVYVCRGLAYNNLGQSDKAIEDFTKAISMGDNDAYLSRAMAYHHLKEMDKAMADANKAVELQPDDLDNYVERASLNYEQGHFAETVADCDHVLNTMSTNGQAHLLRGEAKVALKQFDQALNDLSLAVEILGKSGEAFYYRSLAYKGLGREVDAAADLDSAARLGYQQPAR